jgi:Raf kinase inhibitor-like YbhB/YbcL family protein
MMRAACCVLTATAIFGCPTPADAERPASLEVTSSAFRNNEPIPTQYTCEGDGISPPLAWTDVPANTKSIAILMEDPDAPRGTFTHWLVVGIPPDTKQVEAAAIPRLAQAARNDAGKTGYAGPCPPSGRHHYVFRIYALDVIPAKQLTRARFLEAIRGHVLARGELVGTYAKSDVGLD